jgi:hypothetical protein
MRFYVKKSQPPLCGNILNDIYILSSGRDTRSQINLKIFKIHFKRSSKLTTGRKLRKIEYKRLLRNVKYMLRNDEFKRPLHI